MAVGLALFVSLTSLLLSGCYTTVDPNYNKLLEPPLDGLPRGSTLGPGDRLQIRVFEDEKLGGDFTVSPSGTISFPLVGKLTVEGRTCSDLEDALVGKLAEGYIRRPSVTCSVVEYNSKKVFVFGYVKKPGSFRYEDNMSVIQAVTLAGGFDEQADVNKTSVVRHQDGRKVKAEVPIDEIIAGDVENLQLLPGDIIHVPRSPL